MPPLNLEICDLHERWVVQAKRPKFGPAPSPPVVKHEEGSTSCPPFRVSRCVSRFAGAAVGDCRWRVGCAVGHGVVPVVAGVGVAGCGGVFGGVWTRRGWRCCGVCGRSCRRVCGCAVSGVLRGVRRCVADVAGDRVARCVVDVVVHTVVRVVAHQWSTTDATAGAGTAVAAPPQHREPQPTHAPGPHARQAVAP